MVPPGLSTVSSFALLAATSRARAAACCEQRCRAPHHCLSNPRGGCCSSDYCGRTRFDQALHLRPCHQPSALKSAFARPAREAHAYRAVCRDCGCLRLITIARCLCSTSFSCSKSCLTAVPLIGCPLEPTLRIESVEHFCVCFSPAADPRTLVPALFELQTLSLIPIYYVWVDFRKLQLGL